MPFIVEPNATRQNRLQFKQRTKRRCLVELKKSPLSHPLLDRKDRAASKAVGCILQVIAANPSVCGVAGIGGDGV